MNTTPLQHSAGFNALCEDAKSRIQELSADEAEKLLAQDTTVQLLDVRDRDEWEQGHLPNATFLSKGWIEAKIEKMVPDKTTTIVLYCGGGNRSALAADNLQKMGYQNVYSMMGGIKGWVQQGKALAS